MTARHITFDRYFNQQLSDVFELDVEDELTIDGMFGNALPVGSNVVFLLGDKHLTAEVLETTPYDGPRSIVSRLPAGWLNILDLEYPMTTHRLRVLSWSNGWHAKSVETRGAGCN